MPGPNCAGRYRTFLAVTQDTRRSQIITVISAARRARPRMLNLPRTSFAVAPIVREENTPMAEVTAAVRAVENCSQLLRFVTHN